MRKYSTKGTQVILKTRDGNLRAGVPHRLGSCVFLNDVSQEETVAAPRKHKDLMKQYPREERRDAQGYQSFVEGGTQQNGPLTRNGCSPGSN